MMFWVLLKEYMVGLMELGDNFFYLALYTCPYVLFKWKKW